MKLIVCLSTHVRGVDFAATALLFVTCSMLGNIAVSMLFLVCALDSVTAAFFIATNAFKMATLCKCVAGGSLAHVNDLYLVKIVKLVVTSLIGVFLRGSVVSVVVSCVNMLLFIKLATCSSRGVGRLLSRSSVRIGRAARGVTLVKTLALCLSFVGLFVCLLQVLKSEGWAFLRTGFFCV